MKKFLFIICLANLVVLLISQIDDDLSDESIDLLDRLTINKESQSFLYLAGIAADRSEAPLDVGRQFLAEARKLESGSPLQLVERDTENKIPFFALLLLHKLDKNERNVNGENIFSQWEILTIKQA